MKITKGALLQECSKEGHGHLISDIDTLQEALDDKLDYVILAPVATSGSYADLTDTPTIPTKVSELQNDNKYLVAVPSEYVTEQELAAELVQKSDINHIHKYEEITGVPSIPTKVSELENDRGYLTAVPEQYITEQELAAELAQKSDIDHIHSYEEIIGVPSIPDTEDLVTRDYVTTLVANITDPNKIHIATFGIEEGEDVDVDLNTRKLQEAIDFCKNTKVLVFPSGTFVFNSINLGEKNNITIEGCSSSFASFAQKNIKTGAITDTFTKIICNAPEGETFFQHKNCVLVMNNIAFYNVIKENDKFTTEPAKTNIFMKHTKTSGEGNNTEKGKVFLSNCAFFGWKVCFGDEITLQVLEDELGTGLKESDYSYVKQCCVVAHRCRFTKNGVAINQPVDGRLVDCSFNKNDYALVCREDSGFSTIANCRIEWQIKNGIYCDGAHEMTITDCEFDCNGWAGLFITNNKRSNFSNNNFRRNGAYVETQEDGSHRLDYEKNVHIYANGNKNCIIMGTVTVKKQNNDLGTGTDRPTNCTNFINNTGCIFSYNILNGCTKTDTTDANAQSNNTNCIIGNNIV